MVTAENLPVFCNDQNATKPSGCKSILSSKTDTATSSVRISQRRPRRYHLHNAAFQTKR